ncbi:MAG: hypothetical protein HKM04_11885 [Legionellales bacterium]|nr:hypothetical protein [Legionellales bacterium]
MRKRILILALLSVSISAIAATPTFTACKSKYALCTTAVCTPIPGKKDSVSCQCDVKNGYSIVG